MAFVRPVKMARFQMWVGLHVKSALLARSRVLIAQRVWHAKARRTRALVSSAYHVMVNSWSTVRGRPALHVVPGLAQMSTRLTVSSAWMVGIQRSEYASSALFQMSSLLTKLAVWHLPCAQRARNAPTYLDATIRRTAQPARLALLAHLAVCVKLAVRQAKWQTLPRRFVKRACQAALLLQIAQGA